MKRELWIIAALLTASFLYLHAQEELPRAGRFTIIPEESRLEVTAKSSGMLGFLGHDHKIAPRTFRGEVNVKPQEPAPAEIVIHIDAASLYEAAEFKPEEKQKIETQMNGEVLETAKYPEISFKSSNVSYTKSPGNILDVKADGDLILHGVTKKITVPARVTQDGEKLRASGKFEINRDDYNIETKSAGGGSVKVSKTIEIQFDLVLKAIE